MTKGLRFFERGNEKMMSWIDEYTGDIIIKMDNVKTKRFTRTELPIGWNDGWIEVTRK